MKKATYNYWVRNNLIKKRKRVYGPTSSPPLAIVFKRVVWRLAVYIGDNLN